eukprot:maker-scaffold2006_size22768-snap-gene-0.7 protein:Tk02182 transcript:maker-scaffold2006_size22768-snap-gene-0.7-mRNA-1 annotation:"carboxypeptidase d"
MLFPRNSWGLWLLLGGFICGIHAQRRHARQGAGPSCSAVDGGINMCSYESHQDMINKLTALVARYPDMAQIGTVGKSVQGRDLVFIKISSNVTERSFMEPMFKFVGNMHGDETLGRQVNIYMAEYLLRHYGTDERVRRLVDNTEIFLMPTMNPDGFSTSSPSCGGGFFGALKKVFSNNPRRNARNQDLNRNFPKQFDEDQNVPFTQLQAGREPETQRMMEWITKTPFVLSANMHSGAVVASYPYDDSIDHVSKGKYSASPDDQFFRYAAKLYSKNHPLMSQGHNCRERFEDGITNGAQWYDVPGGMQDFNYLHSNAFEITLELTCCKHIPDSELKQGWLDNKESMLKYMEATHLGVKGMVVDAETKGPIPNAKVNVLTIPHPISTTQRGEYWRLLAPGTYQLYAEAPGYQRSQPIVVNVLEQWPPAAQIHHFQLFRG